MQEINRQQNYRYHRAAKPLLDASYLQLPKSAKNTY